jgi:3-oxoacyl-[acyl-carrier-protein] synthase-3
MDYLSVPFDLYGVYEMIGIKSISCFLPSDFIDNLGRAREFGENEDFVLNKLGASKLPVKSAEQDTSDLAVSAISKLLNSRPDLDSKDIDAIALVTQNPDGQGLPHSSALVHEKLKLSTNVACFDISLGCSGYVYGLYILKGFLESSGLKNGLLVTSDPNSKIIDPLDRSTSLLFGDAATVTWLGEDPFWALGTVAYGTDGSGSEHLKVGPSGHFSMNGRQVFTFASTRIPPHIKEVLSHQQLSPEDIDLYVVHQGSRAIVHEISKKFGDLRSRFACDLDQTGNTVSSSIPMLLERHLNDDSFKRILISGFGVGLSWATAILTAN